VVIDHELRIPPPPFAHLLHLSDDLGVFEHARGTTIRVENGYCTDDVARAVVVLLREQDRPPELSHLASRCLDFVAEAALTSGRFRNRRAAGGRWLDEGGSDDTTGRALLALAVAVTLGTDEQQRRGLSRFEAAAVEYASPSPRSNALAVLAAAEVLEATPGHGGAGILLERAVAGLGRMGSASSWPWPEHRLAYANALLPEGLIAAGAALGDAQLLDEGLSLLDWLVGVESRDGHFSFTPVGGWASGEPRPGFDQQPIEAGAMADACLRALRATGDPRWVRETRRAAAWFLGDNDVGASLLDTESGGCHDGLEPDGCNANEGAEATLAMIAAFQAAQAAARSAPRTSAAATVAAPTQRSPAP
jgi:hypothetical protein